MGLRVGVLTVSDRASSGEMKDLGGPAIVEAVGSRSWTVEREQIVPDERSIIAATLREWCDSDALDVIFTTGGTGLSPRDVTPEATSEVAERPVPGIAEAIRAASLSQTPMAMLSRGLAVVRGSTIIVNLPGSPRGAAEGTNIVLPVLEHAVATLHGGKH
jgi:molybdopterin adenylyltransferase